MKIDDGNKAMQVQCYAQRQDLPDWSELRQLLNLVRQQRGFDASRYIEAKVRLLRDYLADGGLESCVVGVSGGVDSAVVLGLLSRTASLPASPLRRIVAVLLPLHQSQGATNQELATAKGRQVIEAFAGPISVAYADLHRSQQEVQKAVDQGCEKSGGAWAVGQLVSYLRTPALYYICALEAQGGSPALLCGTTNRDEGSYIGFFGKASDGMVDLQLISDLHKSEVREVAQLLGVPNSIIEATPTGDTFDGRVDEEMIGAPYDFLELYLAALEGRCDGLLETIWSRFPAWTQAIEKTHHKNLHKYLANSPAVHLDVYPRSVPGGWRSEAYPMPAKLCWHSPEVPVGLVAPFPLEPWPFAAEAAGPVGRQELLDFGDSACLFENLLTKHEADWFLSQFERAQKVAVNLHGNRHNFEASRDPIGSWRATAYSIEVAQLLWERLRPHFPSLRVFETVTPTDHGCHFVWRAIGINPVLRFIGYEPGGYLVPHYDAGYDYKDGRRYTLMSLVVYLDSHGSTRFLLDAQRHKPISERNHQDWERQAYPHEILCQVEGQPGLAVTFDHRLLHDASPWAGPGQRVLIRTDIIFERCGLQPTSTSPWCRRYFSEKAVFHPMPPKVERDPFYRQLFSTFGGDLSRLQEAGFFEDSWSGQPDGRFEASWMVTPIQKIVDRLEQVKSDGCPLAVLVSTGAFCPVHAGHLELMERAKLELEGHGFSVLGGYLSPSHDQYVTTKLGAAAPGEAVPPKAARATHRLHLCQQAVSSSDWLMVDPWESLHTDAALNFTEVIERLGNYLAAHIRCQRPVEVVYVFGGDNARFVLSFLHRGRCVCVPRQGSQDRFEHYRQHSLIVRCGNIHFASGPPIEDIASSKVRQGEQETLPPRVRELWNCWGRGHFQRLKLFLRDEETWSVQHWGAVATSSQLESCLDKFRESFERLISECFTREGQPFDFCRLRLSEQLEALGQFPPDVIEVSLDPCSPRALNLEVSRCFSLADSQPLAGLVARPGAAEIAVQLKPFERGGRYVLVDDDMATGWTDRNVRQLLGDFPIELLPSIQLCQVQSNEPGALADLMDLRDFLVGSFEGGLVVQLPDGQRARAPYVLPYVQPVERSTLPVGASLYFSRRLWELNRDFFAGLPKLTIAQAFPAFAALAKYLGFSDEDSLESLCQWHVERLSSLGVA